MELRVGQALSSAVDTTQVIVTKAAGGDIDLTCGGVAMVPKGTATEAVAADPAFLQGTLLGKRYVDEDGTIEVLCTKPGNASLAIAGRILGTAEAKTLPSSD